MHIALINKWKINYLIKPHIVKQEKAILPYLKTDESARDGFTPWCEQTSKSTLVGILWETEVKKIYYEIHRDGAGEPQSRY